MRGEGGIGWTRRTRRRVPTHDCAAPDGVVPNGGAHLLQENRHLLLLHGNLFSVHHRLYWIAGGRYVVGDWDHGFSVL